MHSNQNHYISTTDLLQEQTKTKLIYNKHHIHVLRLRTQHAAGSYHLLYVQPTANPCFYKNWNW